MQRSKNTDKSGLATRAHYLFVALALASFGVGCGGDDVNAPPDADLSEILGDFVLTDLTFDPMGSLPEMDLGARLKVQTPPQLTIAATGEAQLTFRSTQTGLTRIADGSWRLTSSGLRVTFVDPDLIAPLALPGTLDLSVDSATSRLSYSGPASGIQRAYLIDLVPEWSQEQLLDPTPGDLMLSFGRAP